MIIEYLEEKEGSFLRAKTELFTFYGSKIGTEKGCFISLCRRANGPCIRGFDKKMPAEFLPQKVYSEVPTI